MVSQRVAVPLSPCLLFERDAGGNSVYSVLWPLYLYKILVVHFPRMTKVSISFSPVNDRIFSSIASCISV